MNFVTFRLLWWFHVLYALLKLQKSGKMSCEVIEGSKLQCV